MSQGNMTNYAGCIHKAFQAATVSVFRRHVRIGHIWNVLLGVAFGLVMPINASDRQHRACMDLSSGLFEGC